jgi:hypothetical protein
MSGNMIFGCCMPNEFLAGVPQAQYRAELLRKEGYLKKCCSQGSSQLAKEKQRWHPCRNFLQARLQTEEKIDKKRRMKRQC